MALEAVLSFGALFSASSCSSSTPSLPLCTNPSKKPWTSRVNYHRASFCTAASPSAAPHAPSSEGEEEEGHALGLPLFGAYDAAYDDQGDGVNGYDVLAFEDYAYVNHDEENGSFVDAENTQNGQPYCDPGLAEKDKG